MLKPLQASSEGKNIAQADNKRWIWISSKPTGKIYYWSIICFSLPQEMSITRMSGSYKNLNSLSLDMNRIHIVFLCFSSPYMMYFWGILLGVFLQFKLILSSIYCFVFQTECNPWKVWNILVTHKKKKKIVTPKKY